MFGRRSKRGPTDPNEGDIARGCTAEPNPYLANHEESDDRYMNLAVDKHNWMVAWRITAALLAISIAFNGYYMTQSKFVPYAVAMDRIGHVIAVGPMEKGVSIDGKRVLRAEIIEWVENARMIAGDRLAQKVFINKVYARVPSTGKAKKQLDDYYRERNVFETATKETAAAEVSLALQTAGNTWQVEWTETWRNLSGEITRRERWKGIFIYDITPLETEQGIRANAAGIFITDFSWSKQI